MQQHGAQQFLRRNGGAPAFAGVFVHAGKQLFELTEGVTRHDPDRPQGVIDWHKVVQLLDAEQALGKGVGCAHAALSCGLAGWGRFFSSLLSGKIDTLLKGYS